MRDNCESALAELDATLVQVKKDRDEEWTRLKSALAAMTKERNGLTGHVSRYAEELEAMTCQRDNEKARAEQVEAKLAEADAEMEAVQTRKDEAVARSLGRLAKLKAVEKVLAWLLDEQAECGNVLNADAVIRRLKQVLSVTSPQRKDGMKDGI